MEHRQAVSGSSPPNVTLLWTMNRGIRGEPAGEPEVKERIP
jgi:hypothetical protein